jgi:DNA-binding response OmpR family regulator
MSNPQILIADDSSTIRELLRRTLTNAGFDVIQACDGREAVEAARSNDPDLIILDIQMPDMDGYAACDEILAAGISLPIIFLTKETAGHLDALGNELGAYLHKPVTEDKLLETVRSLLPRPAPQS